MWLSERPARLRAGRRPAELGVTTAARGGVSVFTDSERRALPVFAPGGYLWRPGFGDEVLVIKYGGGAGVTLRRCEPPAELESGEVCLTSAGGASITLKNDGRILLAGSVFVNGAALAAGGE